jgi:hypothetical protein
MVRNFDWGLQKRMVKALLLATWQTARAGVVLVMLEEEGTVESGSFPVCVYRTQSYSLSLYIRPPCRSTELDFDRQLPNYPADDDVMQTSFGVPLLSIE